MKYTPNPTLIQMLTARSNLSQGEAKASAQTISIDGFSIDGHTAADLLSARPLLLWRGN